MKLGTRLRDKTARVGVIGLGYVGLPLGMDFCKKGFRVTGFDINAERVRTLQKGRSYVLDVASDQIQRFVKAGLFEATTRFDGLAACDIIIICVQTPLRKSREPDLSHIMSAVEEIGKTLGDPALGLAVWATVHGLAMLILEDVVDLGQRQSGLSVLPSRAEILLRSLFNRIAA